MDWRWMSQGNARMGQSFIVHVNPDMLAGELNYRRLARHGDGLPRPSIVDVPDTPDPEPGPDLTDIDPTLLWLLRRAGDEWGPAGVARAATKLAE